MRKMDSVRSGTFNCGHEMAICRYSR